MTQDFITEEVRSLIGHWSPPAQATIGATASEVRRFSQALMDDAPRYWSPQWESKRGYAGLVAPPAYPVHTFRRSSGSPDPLDKLNSDPSFDGLDRRLRSGLPPLDIPLPRLLNGGYEYEFFSYLRIGETAVCRSAYTDIYQKDGKSGTMVFFTVEDRFETTDGRSLLKSINTLILR